MVRCIDSGPTCLNLSCFIRNRAEIKQRCYCENIHKFLTLSFILGDVQTLEKKYWKIINWNYTHYQVLCLWMLDKFACFCRQLIFFKITLNFKKSGIPLECEQIWIQISPTFWRSWNGFKLFATVTSTSNKVYVHVNSLCCPMYSFDDFNFFNLDTSVKDAHWNLSNFHVHLLRCHSKCLEPLPVSSKAKVV